MRWRARELPPEFDSAAQAALAAAAGVPPLLARLLALRDIRGAEEAARFLRPGYADLHSPYLLLGMQTAVDRLQRAVEAREPILIYGDYDVDGTTAVVLLKTAIERCGGLADFHVPHRIREGYGMRDEVIEMAAARGVRLVISVDTGIRAFQAAETARRCGLDLIVTDHHLPEQDEGVPQALAVLNPNQPGCSYPCKTICGAAVAFKLAIALIERLQGAAEAERLLPSFVKMVAIATIADAVPLLGENRALASLGLAGLRRPVNGGLKVLMEVAAVEPGRGLSATDVAFRLAPRLNAAGRMDVACDVVELFTSRDPQRVSEIAAKLNQLNAARQQEEQRILAEAVARADASVAEGSYCLVLHGDGWHRGVIGIVATRVVERTGRPALVVAIEGDEAHGSGRSIPGFHLLEALESCRHLFTRFGGHAHAVGFAMASERLAELCQALEAHARQRLTGEDLDPLLLYDAELPLEQVSFELLDSVRRMEPFGMGNREPVFVAQGVRLLAPPRVLKEKHLKLRLGPACAGRPLEAVGWRMAERLTGSPLVTGQLLDIAFTLDENEHPEFGGLQLVLRDWRAAEARAAANPS